MHRWCGKQDANETTTADKAAAIDAPTTSRLRFVALWQRATDQHRSAEVTVTFRHAEHILIYAPKAPELASEGQRPGNVATDDVLP